MLYYQIKLIDIVKNEILDKSLYKEGGSLGDSGRHAIFRCRRVQKVKVKRSKYKGWDLERVLTEGFDDWWYGHEG